MQTFFSNLYKAQIFYILMDFYHVISRRVCTRSSRPDDYSVKRPNTAMHQLQCIYRGKTLIVHSFRFIHRGKREHNSCVLGTTVKLNAWSRTCLHAHWKTKPSKASFPLLHSTRFKAHFKILFATCVFHYIYSTK